MARTKTETGGRNATTAVIPGQYALSVGRPAIPPVNGWDWTLLSSVAKLESGHTPSRKHPEYWGGDVPWVGIKDATGNHGRVIFDTNETTNELGLANSSARLLPTNTVCLSRTASVGYVVVMGRPMATSQDFVNWVCSDKLNPHYLKYVLLLEQRALHMFAIGSVHQTIYFPEAKAFHICMPAREEQDRIVGILKALDDRIELNRQMNQTLEAIARALFNDWFVDFGPTRAKKDGLSPYLTPEMWALFPDRLDDAGTPAGWTYSPIGQEIQVLGGSTPSTADPSFWDGKIHWATPKDLSNLKAPVLLSTERSISEKGLGQISSGILPVGTVLMSSRAPIGYLAVTNIPVAINQGFIAMVCDKKLSNAFVWQWTQANMNLVHAKANGSTFMEISKGNFKTLPVVVPSSDILKAFDTVVAPILEKITANEIENQTLAQTRDLILPKLMSGEIRIEDTNSIIRETL